MLWGVFLSSSCRMGMIGSKYANRSLRNPVKVRQLLQEKKEKQVWIFLIPLKLLIINIDWQTESIVSNAPSLLWSKSSLQVQILSLDVQNEVLFSKTICFKERLGKWLEVRRGPEVVKCCFCSDKHSPRAWSHPEVIGKDHLLRNHHLRNTVVADCWPRGILFWLLGII